MRTKIIFGLVGIILIASQMPALAQRSQQISGKTCSELFRSCFRICAIRKGEPAFKDCEADCYAGQKSCVGTGTWQSKNATVKVDAATAKSGNVANWTRRQWNAAKAKWSTEKTKWADCNSQATTKKLSGRASWSFLHECMTK